ncbi:hypothetical protein LINPERPRIM_LOCUS5420 [Linum perenne]
METNPYPPPADPFHPLHSTQQVQNGEASPRFSPPTQSPTASKSPSKLSTRPRLSPSWSPKSSARSRRCTASNTTPTSSASWRSAETSFPR